MSDSSQQENPLFTSEVVYKLPFEGEVETNQSYADDGSLVFDIYYPEHRDKNPPVIIFVTGYPDPGYQSIVGAPIKELPQIKSWARMFAASGVAAVTYTNTAPAKDVFSLLRHLESHEDELGIDANKIAIWACSGNVPNALAVLMEENIRGAVLAYGFMLDSEGSDVIAQTAKSVGFVYPSLTLSEIPADKPLLIIRAGKDEFDGLNGSIDNFLQESLKRNLTVSLSNYPDGVHAFDILDHSKESQQIIKNMLEFVKTLLN